ncbi:hypothetical protein R3W88_022933 [Solanum pinnatisectum]|uniref:Uncharacterized protein n=1 Tax=Solanum pinnatisectum TaxID=50273 RepID=A0AAV9LZ20_9SOLN|nr:hypothetical protein R3W88_022933 [Solanum pinnatisectum]
MPRSVRDRLRDQFSKLEQGPMTASEFGAWHPSYFYFALMDGSCRAQGAQCSVRGPPVLFSSLLDRICGCQFEDESLVALRDRVLAGDAKQATLDSDGVLRFDGRLCVSRAGGLIQLILSEAHDSRYSIHSGTAKMYHDLR